MDCQKNPEYTTSPHVPPLGKPTGAESSWPTISPVKRLTIQHRLGRILVWGLVSVVVLLFDAAVSITLTGGWTTGHPRTKDVATMVLVEDIGTAIDKYAAEFSKTGRLPPEDADSKQYTASLLTALHLANLMEITEEDIAPHPDHPRLVVFVDAWGTPLRYRPWHGVEGDKTEAHNANSYDLWSAGPDRLFGPGDADGDGVDDAADNICNWIREREE